MAAGHGLLHLAGDHLATGIALVQLVERDTRLAAGSTVDTSEIETLACECTGLVEAKDMGLPADSDALRVRAEDPHVAQALCSCTLTDFQRDGEQWSDDLTHSEQSLEAASDERRLAAVREQKIQAHTEDADSVHD